MKMVSKEELIAGKYYMEYDTRHDKGIFVTRFTGQMMMLGIYARKQFLNARYLPGSTWRVTGVHGTLYELNDDEVLQYVVMEGL